MWTTADENGSIIRRMEEQLILPGLKLVRDTPWRIVADNVGVLPTAEVPWLAVESHVSESSRAVR
jgi:hypothetical protein